MSFEATKGSNRKEDDTNTENIQVFILEEFEVELGRTNAPLSDHLRTSFPFVFRERD